MTGSLQTKGNKYYVVARIPDVTGRSKSKWISTGLDVKGTSRREAKRVMQRILADLEAQNAVYSTETPFLVWVDKWMEQKQQGIRLNTWESYQLYLEVHIRPYFAPKKLTLNKLTAQHLQDYYNRKLRDGLAVNTLKKHHAVIRGALREAVKKRMLTFNPADQVTFPRQNKQRRFHGTAYTAEQALHLLQVFKGDVLEPTVILGLCYGLRRSEVLGLRWSDIDFDAGTLSIQNTVTRMKTLLEHEETKSAASKRLLYLMSDTIPYLRRLHTEQQKHQTFLGEAYHISDHVCVWPDGRPLSPDYVSQHFKRILTKSDLQPIRFHDLRHTAGSLLMNNGVTIKQVQEFLGHEKASTTLDIYTHIDKEAKLGTARSMELVLHGHQDEERSMLEETLEIPDMP